MKEKNLPTTLGVDAVFAQLAPSVREAIISSSKKEPKLSKIAGNKRPYAYCLDTETTFHSREELLLFLWQRTEHFLDEGGEVNKGVGIFYLQKVHYSGKVSYKYERTNFLHTCPITGNVDVSQLVVHIKNVDQYVELGQLGLSLALVQQIAMMTEDLAPFLKYYFQHVFDNEEVFVHLDTVPLKGEIKTYIVT